MIECLRPKDTSVVTVEMFLFFFNSFNIAFSLISANSLLRCESGCVHSVLIGLPFQHHCSLETVCVGGIWRIV